jgi:hypothetical protein
MPKNIVVYSDGTGQDGGIRPEQRVSNVYKLYRLSAKRRCCQRKVVLFPTSIRLRRIWRTLSRMVGLGARLTGHTFTGDMGNATERTITWGSKRLKLGRDYD